MCYHIIDTSHQVQFISLFSSKISIYLKKHILHNVKSDDRLALAVAALEGEVTSRDVQRAKSLSTSGKRPIIRSCEVMTFAVTGHKRVRRASVCQLVYGLPRHAT